MNEDVSDGWAESAAAWIVEQGEDGDYGRRFVLDAPMRQRIEGRGFRNALDVGCGEGRFCRILRRAGIRTTGIDPTEALLAQGSLTRVAIIGSAAPRQWISMQSSTWPSAISA
jgi:2-polyprenyl-3-methyl-5-hydroxy-6-metoxy-1,4-benzoquinol methylase